MSRGIPNSPRRELHSEDLPMRTLDAIEDLDKREPEVIVAVDPVSAGGYIEDLAFMEEPVIVILHRGREKHAPEYEMFGVNGQVKWVKVETPTRLERKFLEVMARSQPMDVRTDSGEDAGDAITFNRTHRSLSANFSFSVIEDKNPKGAAWLAKVRREN